jgi:AhpD family alkylhydroperoxidase
MLHREERSMAEMQGRADEAKYCPTRMEPAGISKGRKTPKSTLEPKLQDLIPIAVVIAAGCESCAEKMVKRAMEMGSSREYVQKTIQIVAHLQKLDCLVEAIGPEGVARMEKPLAAANATLLIALRCD